MSNKRVFEEKTRSRLTDLVVSNRDIISGNLNLRLYNQIITIGEIQKRMIDLPFIDTCKKEDICLEGLSTDEIQTALEKFPKGNENLVVEFVKVKNMPNVKFCHANLKNGQYLPPRLLIDLTKEKFTTGYSVRINTGYIVRIKSVAMGKTVVDGKITNTSIGRQIDGIILPTVVSRNAGIVPTIYARDPEDTGMLIVNFTVVDAEKFTNRKLQVAILGYQTLRPLTCANIADSESVNTELFKPKDSKTGRLVKNPKVKYFSNEFLLESPKGPLKLKTFDSTKSPIVVYEKQMIKLDNIIVLFSSRRREWCDPNLFTTAGIFNPINGKHIVPKIAKGSKFTTNTHGMTFLKCKINVFSVDGELGYDLRILNGAFKNIPVGDYKELIKRSRHMVGSYGGLMVGAKMCDSISKKTGLDFDALVRIMDYSRGIDANDPKLSEKVNQTENQLFDNRPTDALPYSVWLYRALKYFAFIFCKDRFTEEQLDELSKELTANKRPEEQSDVQSGEKRSLEDQDSQGPSSSKRFKAE